MPSLATEHDFKRANQRLDRCYLCGMPLTDGRPTNRDHAPPRALFLEADRSSPLILPTHVACNGSNSRRDEIVGQLVQVLNDRRPDPAKDRRGLEAVPDQQGRLHAVLPARHLFFSWEIDRWVRACHALLYGTVLPRIGVKRNIHPPMPTGTFTDDNKVQFDEVLPQIPKFVEVIKRNRMTNSIDAIAAWNGAFRYECTWVTANDGRWFCIWAMRIYNWEQLGETWPTQRRGCVGCYMPPEGKPRDATVGTALDFPVPSTEPLDPFAA